MATIATFGSIIIDDTELVEFSLEVAINYSMNQKQRNGCVIQHTGLSSKKAMLSVRISDYNSYILWDNLLNNYNKQIVNLTIAGNTERSWIIEGVRITLINMITPSWDCVVNLIG